MQIGTKAGTYLKECSPKDFKLSDLGLDQPCRLAPRKDYITEFNAERDRHAL